MEFWIYFTCLTSAHPTCSASTCSVSFGTCVSSSCLEVSITFTAAEGEQQLLNPRLCDSVWVGGARGDGVDGSLKACCPAEPPSIMVSLRSVAHMHQNHMKVRWRKTLCPVTTPENNPNESQVLHESLDLKDECCINSSNNPHKVKWYYTFSVVEQYDVQKWKKKSTSKDLCLYKSIVITGMQKFICQRLYIRKKISAIYLKIGEETRGRNRSQSFTGSPNGLVIKIIHV